MISSQWGHVRTVALPPGANAATYASVRNAPQVLQCGTLPHRVHAAVTFVVASLADETADEIARGRGSARF